MATITSPPTHTARARTATARRTSVELPVYATIPLEEAPTFSHSKDLSLNSREVLRELLESWADNGCQHLPSNHFAWIGRISRDDFERAKDDLCRRGLLIQKQLGEDKARSIFPSRQALSLFFREGPSALKLTGKAKVLQPTEQIDILHLDATLSALQTVKFLSENGTATPSAISRALRWSNESTVFWLKHLSKENCIAGNQARDALVLTAEGSEALTFLRNRLMPTNKAHNRFNPESSLDLHSEIPRILQHLAIHTGFSLGFSEREIQVALGLRDRSARGLKALDELVTAGVLTREKHRLNQQHPELKRLVSGTMLYRIASPEPIAGTPPTDLLTLAEEIKKGVTSTQRTRRAKAQSYLSGDSSGDGTLK